MNVLEQFSLKNKIVLVTGAAGHLGSQMVWALAQMGAHVILNGRNRANLQAMQNELHAQNFEATLWAIDITDKEVVSNELPIILDKFGQLDVLINNAYAGVPATLEKSRVEQFAQAYDLCVSSAFHLIQTALPHLKQAAKQTSAAIINVSSMYGVISPDPSIYHDSGMNNPPYYGAAKAALLQLTRYLACHLATDNIRVNALVPGAFPKSSQELKERSPEFYKDLCQKIPMQRVGAAHELQGAVVFLASQASSFMTGAQICIDGGMTAW